MVREESLKEREMEIVAQKFSSKKSLKFSSKKSLKLPSAVTFYHRNKCRVFPYITIATPLNSSHHQNRGTSSLISSLATSARKAFLMFPYISLSLRRVFFIMKQMNRKRIAFYDGEIVLLSLLFV
jgi:hypothetical protein